MADAYNLNTWKAEAGGLLWIQGHPKLHTKQDPMSFFIKN